MEQKKATVVLVAFYNKKAMGVRYLETSLREAGYRVVTIFYKGFHSVHPQRTSQEEIALLCKEIEKEQPVLVGLSVMSSMYLDTVHLVMDGIRKNFAVPIVCGGAYATMFPERLLRRGASFVIRADGEIPLRLLADALCSQTAYSHLPSLCFYREDGSYAENEIGCIQDNIDLYGLPAVHSEHARYIEHGTVSYGDPQLDMPSYEIVASRGCPFTCSYCCCVNLGRLLPKRTRSVRTRSVKSVIEELTLAKRECKRLVFVHFYDEIFPNLPGWVDDFVEAYQKQVGLPFTIWSHPKMVREETLKKLVPAGLTEVIMGIQSGSERVRRDVFHRYESQQEIIAATRAIRKAGVSWASYDFMLRHPFETTQDLQETYWLVKRLYPPFELQLHGLNFLPGTDIVAAAVEQGYYTEEEMENILYAPMEEQFAAYWTRDGCPENQLWYQMIYCLQFRFLRGWIAHYEHEPLCYKRRIRLCYWLATKLFRVRHLFKKAAMLWKSYTGKRRWKA